MVFYHGSLVEDGDGRGVSGCGGVSYMVWGWKSHGSDVIVIVVMKVVKRVSEVSSSGDSSNDARSGGRRKESR